MATPAYPSIAGTVRQTFAIGKGALRRLIKVTSGGFFFRDAADAADVPVTAETFNATGDSIAINSDAAGTGSDFKLELARNSAATEDTIIEFPPGAGSTGQVLTKQSDGSTDWATPTSGASNGVLVDTTSIAYNTSSPAAMFTLNVGQRMIQVRVLVTTVFDDPAATLSVGKSGVTAKYVGTDEVDLSLVGEYIIWCNAAAVSGSNEAVIASISPGTSTAGAATIECDYGTPN